MSSPGILDLGCYNYSTLLLRATTTPRYNHVQQLLHATSTSHNNPTLLVRATTTPRHYLQATIDVYNPPLLLQSSTPLMTPFLSQPSFLRPRITRSELVGLIYAFIKSNQFLYTFTTHLLGYRYPFHITGHTHQPTTASAAHTHANSRRRQLEALTKKIDLLQAPPQHHQQQWATPILQLPPTQRLPSTATRQ
ncbi:hypothetical protein Pcinc_009166 [Petrolisthes cinctipes]|uniref:Uncharacterized protein n=1 Tax=Petrolisthes cinctipes TaxID=88211 RepID=A0AAE1G564_PETCI|nr:hypothetical protein Pcinc_009160 [Petrolisthes cinctipes]KAK3886700.1 hypothetical protein Pcinc_009166 [Petrolisthes cinctipes]